MRWNASKLKFLMLYLLKGEIVCMPRNWSKKCFMSTDRVAHCPRMLSKCVGRYCTTSSDNLAVLRQEWDGSLIFWDVNLRNLFPVTLIFAYLLHVWRKTWLLVGVVDIHGKYIGLCNYAALQIDKIFFQRVQTGIHL